MGGGGLLAYKTSGVPNEISFGQLFVQNTYIIETIQANHDKNHKASSKWGDL